MTRQDTIGMTMTEMMQMEVDALFWGDNWPVINEDGNIIGIVNAHDDIPATYRMVNWSTKRNTYHTTDGIEGWDAFLAA